MFPLLLNPIIILMSLSTAMGVLIHDTRLDKATTAAIALPAIMANYDINSKFLNFGSDPHTHVERSTLSQVLRDINGRIPRLTPRTDEKKHMMQKVAPKGHHAFDNYNHPLA